MQNFLLATVTEVDQEKNHVKVKYIEYDDIIEKDFIPVMMPAIGEGQEAGIAPLGVDDLVIVTFFDMTRQSPFVLGKIYTSGEFIEGKKIKFYDHEVDFQEDELIVKHKSGNSVITLKESEIVVESSSVVTVDATTVKLGSGALESVIKGDSFKIIYDTSVHTGNLGYLTSPPVVSLPPNVLSTKVKTE